MISRTLYETSGQRQSQELLETTQGLALLNRGGGVVSFTRTPSAQPAAVDSRHLATSSGIPLNLLVDVAIGKVGIDEENRKTSHLVNFGGRSGGLKRTSEDSTSLVLAYKGFHKKKRVEVATNNTVLMQRLSALSGGFPMPKWGAFKQKNKTTVVGDALKLSKEIEIPPKSIGAFPLPRVKEEDSVSRLTKAPMLDSFKQVWEQKEWAGDVELRKEVLSRKLLKGIFRR